MKNNLLITGILLILLMASCTHTEESFYKNGIKSSEITYRGNTPEGVARFWHPNGELMQENTYIDGMVSGVLKRWHPNGNPEAEEEYVNDLKNGVSKEYNNDGKLILEAFYINDTLNGKYQELYPSGHKKVTGEYKNGLYEGEWKWYDADGVLLGEAEFRGGSGIQKAWRRDGSLLRKIEYYKNLKHGSEIHYNEKGDVEKELIYEENSVVEVDDAE